MRCKNCREKFEPARFNMKYCLKDECVRVFVEEVKAKQWKQKKQKIKARDATLVSPFPHLLSLCFVGDLSASSKTTMLSSVWKPEHPSAR